jgi:hypothetical protein
MNAISDALEAALKQIHSNNGLPGWRQTYDQAIHIVVALRNAGYKITKIPVRPTAVAKKKK